MTVYFYGLSDTGMVTIEAPTTTVCYESTPQLKCKFEEVSDNAGWSKKTLNESLGLNTGSVVKMIDNCATEEYKSCVGVKLQNVTGLWSGEYSDILLCFYFVFGANSNQ